MHPTHTAILQAIITDPFDLCARMALADWLMESDEPGLVARGEFIGVQLQLDQRRPYLPPAEILEIANSNRLYAQSAMKLIEEKARENNDHYERLHQRERDLQAQLWPDGVVDPDRSPWGGLRFSGRVKYRYRRGLVEHVECSCGDWLAHGPEVVQAQPVTSVRPWDRKPHCHSSSEVFFRYYTSGDESCGAVDELPHSLWEVMHRETSLPWHTRTADELNDRLSRAAVVWARRQAGLPALIWPEKD